MTDREIDKLIAEKLFGATDFNMDGVAMVGNFGDRYKPCPHYSTDLAAAWTAVEKLNWLQFTVERENCSGVRYDACCYNH